MNAGAECELQASAPECRPEVAQLKPGGAAASTCRM